MQPAVAEGQGVSPILLRVAGVILLALVMVPMLRWGNPYPAAAIAYWGIGGAVVFSLTLLVTLVPAIGAVLSPEPLLRTASRLSARQFACAVAIISTALAIWFAWAVFFFRASTTDELAQLWHARILLTGRWALPIDPNRAFFALDTVVDNTLWFSQFPIGGPMLLAVGSLIGAPWLINTLATGASAAAMYGFARHAYGESEARLIAFVMAVAPSVTMMGGTMMNHTPVLLLWMVVLWLLTGWEQARTVRDGTAQATAIGVALGLMATIRPLDAVVAATATAAFQWAVFVSKPKRAIEWGAQALGGVVGLLPLMIAHAATTGHPLRFAYDLQWGTGHNLGFHVDPYGNAFTWQKGAGQALTYLGELAMFVTAWPIPCLLLVAATLLLVRKASRWDVLLLGHFGLQLAVHAVYWGRGEFLGPRFLFTALPSLIVFIARLPLVLQWRVSPRWRPAIPVAFAAMMLVSWFAPARALGVRGLMQIAAQSRVAVRADVAGAVRDAGIESGVVFLREPFSARLTRRLWGLGLRRDETAQLLARHDACAVHRVVARFEQERSIEAFTPMAVRGALEGTTAFAPSDTAMSSGDGVLSLNGPGSLDPGCRTEFDADTTGGFVAFGVGLPLEPIDAAGRVAGNVVYAADLGPVNAKLAKRFGDRPWYLARTRGREVRLEKIPVPGQTQKLPTQHPPTPN